MGNKNGKLKILLTVLLLGGIFYFSYLSRFADETNSYVTINSHKFSVEIADSPEERSLGLGGRESLCENCGMLFKFPEAKVYTFWMKDMQFPLDIIWIMEGKIVYIAKNVPAGFKGTIGPGISADNVFEINAGLSDEYGIEEGSEAVIR